MFNVVGFWPWLAVAAAASSISGIVLSYFVPGGVLRERVNQWRPIFALVVAFVLGTAVALLSHLVPLVVLISFLGGYLFSRPPQIGLASLVTQLRRRLAYGRDKLASSAPKPEAAVDRMVFLDDWNIRPRFETEEQGRFVGREEILGRLSSHFISHGGGTILISGVRGVGKTALVDRALVDARQKLAEQYWHDLSVFLAGRWWLWHPIWALIRRTLLKLGEGATATDYLASKSSPSTGQQLQLGASVYVSRPSRRFVWRFNPIGICIRKIYEASKWQLFVLKFSASDISGAMAEPDAKPEGKPKIDPEKLLRSVIRKLFMTCHISRQKLEDEARILDWSLFDKEERKRFFDTLQSAYDKSVTKSYSEVVSKKINDFEKQSRSIVSERKLNLARFAGVAAALALYLGIQRIGIKVGPLSAQNIGAVVGGFAAYLTWAVTSKWSRESGSGRSRQAQFSYEYDYSLERMQRDLESIMRTLQPFRKIKFHPLRCFTRSAVIFDELDKLEDADKQLDDVITHFKNFFTLSETVFVFLTDHTFYEHLIREAIKAQMDRHYSPQHTFFTEKIYLRKPNFTRFREAFYNFTDSDWIVKRASSSEAPSDPVLTEYLLNGNLVLPESLPLETLTHLYIHRRKYDPDHQKAIEEEFERREGRKNPMALARIWVSEASAKDTHSLRKTEQEFNDIGGWSNADAVSYLYYFRKELPRQKSTVSRRYEQLGKPSLGQYESVSDIQFSLSDLAYALCFQTRNHYFDLYQMIYDYVNAYVGGAPVLPLDDKRFTQESRLSSRYQQLLEIAFDSVSERRPSREYFNGLVMESLYRVFDKRAVGEAVTIRDVLQSNGTSTKAPRRKLAEPPTFAGRDVEKTNRAILLLLQLALVHRAISSKSPNLEKLLWQEPISWGDLADGKFEWNDDIEPIIRVLYRGTHEDDLLNFWNENRDELEALDADLAQLWNNATMSDETTKLRSVIAELRSKAESVRLKSVKISRADAGAIKANVGTSQTRSVILPTIVMDRIRAEDDAFILDNSGTIWPDATAAPPPRSVMESRRRSFEAATKLSPHAVISPYNTDAIFCFVAGTVPTRLDVEWSSILKEDDYVFWLTPAPHKKTPPSDKVRFYCAAATPSMRDLLSDYRARSRESRLSRILERWESSGSKDADFPRRFGAEAVGPIEAGSEIQVALSEAAVVAVISALKSTQEEILEHADDIWTRYQLHPSASADQMLDKLAARVIDFGGPPTQGLQTGIRNVLADSLGFEPTGLKADTLLRLFLSETDEPNFLGLLVVVYIARQIARQITTPIIRRLDLDDSMSNAVVNEFASWLGGVVKQLAETRSLTIEDLLSQPGWPIDVEKARRLLTLSALPTIKPRKRLSARLAEPKPTRPAKR